MLILQIILLVSVNAKSIILDTFEIFIVNLNNTIILNASIKCR